VSLSICIVGCGEQAGKILDEALPVLDDVSLYFTSEYLSDARRYNDTYGGVGVFDSFEDAVRDPGVDAVYLATPHHLHLGHTLIAAAQRKHILVEKPIAMTVPEAWRMISCARDSGVVLMVSEPVRYLSTVDKCNELIADGEIGDLRLVHVQNQAFDIPLEWRTDASLRGGGELIDGGIHSIDILVNIGGLPEKVYAVLPNRLFGEVDGDDGAVMTARLPGGVIGLLNHSSSTSTKESDFWVMVTANKGQIRFEPGGSEVTVDTADGVRTISVENGTSVRRMMAEFVACANSGVQPIMTGEEGAKDVAVALAAYESDKLGSEADVSVPF